jgi:hypothetical protein
MTTFMVDADIDVADIVVRTIFIGVAALVNGGVGTLTGRISTYEIAGIQGTDVRVGTIVRRGTAVGHRRVGARVVQTRINSAGGSIIETGIVTGLVTVQGVGCVDA